MKTPRGSRDYTRITLTDEQPIPDGARRLQTVYHGLLRLDYDNSRTRAVWQAEEARAARAEDAARAAGGIV